VLPPPRPRKPGQSSAIWPLPVRGRIEVRAGFIQHKRYRVEPFEGVFSLEPERGRLEAKAARMCGVSFPMELQMEPERGSAAIHLAMKDQPIEKVIGCLTGGKLDITGNADLAAELRIEGRRPHLVRALSGPAQVELRNGQVKKFALIGNILSFRNIASKERMEDGFPYRSLHARGRFEGGAFLLEEGGFDSDAINLGAHGRVDLLGATSQLDVLIGLLTNVDRVAGMIPIIGDVFGGSMSGLPIRVSGDIRDPLVVPLDPRAITNRLLGILGRTAKLPGKLLVKPSADAPPTKAP